MFYRVDFAARDAFLHIPALLSYGLLTIYRFKDLFAEYEKLPKGLPIKLIVLSFGSASLLIVPVAFFWLPKVVSLMMLGFSVVVFIASVKIFREKNVCKNIYSVFDPGYSNICFAGYLRFNGSRADGFTESFTG